jgi:O-antigen/teichoic acid export membrane protein
MASMMLLSRHLQPAGYGKYNVALTMVGFAAMFTDFGLNNIAVREMSRDRQERARLFGNLLLLKTVLAVLSLLGVGVFLLCSDTAADVRQAVGIASFYLFFATLCSAEIVFQVELKLWYPSLVTTVAGLLSLGLISVGVARGWTVVAFVLIYVMVSLLNGTALLLYAMRLLAPCLALDLALWKWLLLEALPIGLRGVASMVSIRLNTLLLFYFCGAEVTGLFGAAFKFPDLFQFIPAALMTPVFPLLSEYFVHDEQRLGRAYQRCLDVLLLMVLPSAVGMSLLSERIVHWVYGSEYVQAGPVLAVVSFQIVGMFVGYVGGYMMMAINQQRKALWTDVSMRAREMAIDRGKRARGT